MRSLEITKAKLARRKLRIRKKINGTETRPRLTIYKSNKHLYAQAVDDTRGFSLCHLTTVNDKSNPNVALATKLGKDFAQKLKEKKIDSVVFDRNGYRYHGVIKAFVDSLRENGIKV